MTWSETLKIDFLAMRHLKTINHVSWVSVSLLVTAESTSDSRLAAATSFGGAPIAHLGECPTLDRKVVGSILTRRVVLCP